MIFEKEGDFLLGEKEQGSEQRLAAWRLTTGKKVLLFVSLY